MKCETCKKETEALYQEKDLYFCSLVCFALHIRDSREWKEPLIPLHEAIYPKLKPTIH